MVKRSLKTRRLEVDIKVIELRTSSPDVIVDSYTLVPLFILNFNQLAVQWLSLTS